MNVWLFMLAAAAATTMLLAWFSLNRGGRVVLGVYAGAYVLTTVIGAAAVGVAGSSVLDNLAYGLQTRMLEDLSSPLYWGLLLAPLIVVPGVMMLLRSAWWIDRMAEMAAKVLNGPITFWMHAIVFACFVAYCAAELFHAGLAGSLENFLSLRGDYLSIIVLRMEVLSKLGICFAAVVYSTLPALTQCALYMAVRTKSWRWRIALAVSIMATAVLCLMVIQKSLLVILFVFLGVGLMELGVVRWRTAAVLAAAAFLIVAGLQRLYLTDLTLRQNLYLTVFRVASSFPYYVNLYPQTLQYTGIPMGLDILGLAEPVRDNLDVFDQMYPDVISYMQGAVAAPAHVRAYSQAGFGFSVCIMVVIGGILSIVAAVRRHVRGPLAYAFYIQSLVLAYYFTQISVRDGFLTSYGLLWTLAGLVPLAALIKLRKMVLL